eukprot:163998_1
MTTIPPQQQENVESFALFNINKPLPPTDGLFCGASLIMYSYLGFAGIFHALDLSLYGHTSYQQLYYDIAMLCVLYVYETLIAVITKRSTLYRWRVIAFLMHHLPYSVVTGYVLLAYDLLGTQLYRWTSILNLLVSFSEGYQVLLALHVPFGQTFDFYRRLYLIVIIGFTIIAEISESMNVLFFVNDEQFGFTLYVIAFIVATLPPCYHVFQCIVPNYKKMCKMLQNPCV